MSRYFLLPLPPWVIDTPCRRASTPNVRDNATPTHATPTGKEANVKVHVRQVLRILPLPSLLGKNEGSSFVPNQGYSLSLSFTYLSVQFRFFIWYPCLGFYKPYDTGQTKSFLLFLKSLKGPIKSWPTKNDRKRYGAVVYYTLCAYPGPVTMPA